MKRDIFLSTFSYNATKEITEFGIGIEFNQFCISQWLDDETIDETLMKMERQAYRCGLHRKDRYPGELEWPEEKPYGDVIDPAKAVVHGPFTDLAPAAFDHRFRTLTKDRLQQAAAGTMRLGLSRMVVHTGYIPLIFDPRWQVKESIGFWKDFLEDKPADFQLLLENVMDEDPALLSDIIEGVDDPRMRICLDVGHVNAVSPISAEEWIRRLGHQILHFHLHNNDGERDLHAPLHEGTMDIEAVLRTIDECCLPEATFTIESRNCHESIPWLQQWCR